VAADNVLVKALREQGFTHLVVATKHRNSNVISLTDGALTSGRGQLEGLGFFLDPTIQVQSRRTGQLSEGILAPYLYIQLRLIDLAALDVKATRTITANGAVSNGGADAWKSLSPAQKIDALQALIRAQVRTAIPPLFGAN
jgi:hypothetical protein